MPSSRAGTIRVAITALSALLAIDSSRGPAAADYRSRGAAARESRESCAGALARAGRRTARIGCAHIRRRQVRPREFVPQLQRKDRPGNPGQGYNAVLKDLNLPADQNP